MVYSVTVSPNGRFIVSASKDKSIKIFDIAARQEVGHLGMLHDCKKLLIAKINLLR